MKLILFTRVTHSEKIVERKRERKMEFHALSSWAWNEAIHTSIKHNIWSTLAVFMPWHSVSHVLNRVNVYTKGYTIVKLFTWHNILFTHAYDMKNIQCAILIVLAKLLANWLTGQKIFDAMLREWDTHA